MEKKGRQFSWKHRFAHFNTLLLKNYKYKMFPVVTNSNRANNKIKDIIQQKSQHDTSEFKIFGFS